VIESKIQPLLYPAPQPLKLYYAGSLWSFATQSHAIFLIILLLLCQYKSSSRKIWFCCCHHWV